MGQSLEETRHKLPSPLLVESPRTHFVLPAAHCDGTCDLFIITPPLCSGSSSVPSTSSSNWLHKPQVPIDFLIFLFLPSKYFYFYRTLPLATRMET